MRGVHSPFAFSFEERLRAQWDKLDALEKLYQHCVDRLEDLKLVSWPALHQSWQRSLDQINDRISELRGE